MRLAYSSPLNSTRAASCDQVILSLADEESERLLTEIEETMRLLVPPVTVLGPQFCVELDLAVQPLRTENSHLRRSVHYLCFLRIN